MDLREAIELIEDNHPKNGPFIGQDFYSVPATQKAEAHAFSVILNAVADGTLIPADAVFQVREGFRVYALKSNGAFDIVSAPLTEALEIRSADDVRRGGYLEGHNDGYRAALSRPKPKGDDNEIATY